MVTIYENSSEEISPTAAGQVTTVTRGVSVGGYVNFGAANSRLNNFGSVMDLGVYLAGQNDKFYNYQSGLVFSESDAVRTSSGFTQDLFTGFSIKNYGDIISSGGNGVSFNVRSSGTVENMGTITSETKAAIHSFGSGTIVTITNSGDLAGVDGVFLEGNAYRTTIRNSGDIVVDNYAVKTSGGNTFYLENSGLIDGIILANTENGADTVINSGRMLRNVNLGSGNDTYTGTGSGYAIRVYGDAGVDRLTGSSASDYFSGGADNDILDGGSGADILAGGQGKDSLRGGSGSDLFQFRTLSESTYAAAGRDTIYDFVQSQKDKIDLVGVDANVAKSGDQAFIFVGSKAFSKAAGELRVSNHTSDTYIYGDVDGDGKADFAVHLDDAINLVKGDFLL